MRSFTMSRRLARLPYLPKRAEHVHCAWQCTCISFHFRYLSALQETRCMQHIPGVAMFGNNSCTHQVDRQAYTYAYFRCAQESDKLSVYAQRHVRDQAHCRPSDTPLVPADHAQRSWGQHGSTAKRGNFGIFGITRRSIDLRCGLGKEPRSCRLKLSRVLFLFNLDGTGSNCA